MLTLIRSHNCDLQEFTLMWYILKIYCQPLFASLVQKFERSLGLFIPFLMNCIPRGSATVQDLLFLSLRWRCHNPWKWDRLFDGCLMSVAAGLLSSHPHEPALKTRHRMRKSLCYGDNEVIPPVKDFTASFDQEMLELNFVLQIHICLFAPCLI